jgi:hypothetical protein
MLLMGGKMKKIFIIMLVLTGFQSYADEIDDIFGGGEDQEFEFERFSEENVMRAIAHDASIVCKKGLCKLTSVETNRKEFAININAGLGNNSSGGFGGFGSGTGGTFINFREDQHNGGETRDRVHAGINMQLHIGQCVRSVNIPRSLYYSINRYLYGLMNEDSTIRRSLNPADEAMIIFYSTIMKMAQGCQ